MLRAIVHGDIIVNIIDTSADIGYPIPDDLQHLPAYKLRFNGVSIVDATQFSYFYIDDAGTKHITQLDSTWQKIKCSFDDVLVRDGTNGKWIIKPFEYYLNERKSEMIEQLDKRNRSFIDKKYPTMKLLGLFKLKIYFEQLLSNKQLSEGEITVIQSKISKIDQVDQWITSVMYKYKELVDQINNAKTLNELGTIANRIDEAYKQLDMQDPNVFYTELM